MNTSTKIFYYSYGVKVANDLWNDYEDDKCFFEAYYDTKDFDFTKNKMQISRRSYVYSEPDDLFTQRIRWILKTNYVFNELSEDDSELSSSDNSYSYSQEKFKTKEEICKRLDIEKNTLKEYCAVRIDRFFAKCQPEICKNENCASIDIHVRSWKDLGVPSICYAVSHCKHKLITKHLPSPHPSLIFLSTELDEKVFNSISSEKERKLIEKCSYWEIK